MRPGKLDRQSLVLSWAEHSPMLGCGELPCMTGCVRWQIKSVRIDVEAYSLSDTWETTSYQRAIGVEPLWDTFLMLLQKSSQIRINQLMFVGYRVSGHASKLLTLCHMYIVHAIFQCVTYHVGDVNCGFG